VRHAAPDELHVDPCPGRFCRFAGNRPSRTTYRPYNVVAIIRGSDDRLKDEHITVAAHLDGAVGSRAVDGDAVYNSADDNASGSAAMTAWLMLFLVQSLLVPARRPNSHEAWLGRGCDSARGRRQRVHARRRSRSDRRSTRR